MEPRLQVIRVIRVITTTTMLLASYIAAGYAQQSAQDSLLRLLQDHPGQDDRRAELLNALAFMLHTAQPDSTVAYVDEVIGFAAKLQDQKNLSSAYSIKGIAYLFKSELQNAEIWTEKALAIDRKIGHQAGIAANTSNLALIFFRQNNYPAALAQFQQAAQQFGALNDPKEIMIYLNMSGIYAETKNFRKAEEYMQLARERNKQANDPRLEGYALLNLGTLYIDEGDHQKGRRYLDSALVANQQVNDQGNIAKVYGNLGSSFAKTHDYIRANDYHKRALAINTTIGNSRSIAVNHCGIGECYTMLDSLPQAYQHLSLARAISKQLDAIDLKRDIAQNLSQYFEKTARFDSALYYHKQFLTYKDSLDNEANQNQLTRLELQYDFDLKEQEYVQQQAIRDLQFRQLWLYGILIIGALLSLGGYLLSRSRTRTLRLRNEIRENELNQQAAALLLQQQLSESELKALRSQMNPHFMFNVLSSIESYILEQDAKSASRLVQRFAKLTRFVLENSTQPLVSANREWEAVRLYVELEAERFEHPFTYEFTVVAPLQLSEVRVPPMLIQPLAENAILHGIRPATGYPTHLHLSIGIEANHLAIYVTDNGIGLAAAKTHHRKVTAYKEKSLGLAAIEERLVLLKSQYPQSHPSLTVTPVDPQEGTGTQARLLIPLIPVSS